MKSPWPGLLKLLQVQQEDYLHIPDSDFYIVPFSPSGGEARERLRCAAAEAGREGSLQRSSC